MSADVTLVPVAELDREAWSRIAGHFRDKEISWLNGTPATRLPVWLLRVILKADISRTGRHTFGIRDEEGVFIGLCELYDIKGDTGTLGIIIGERSHWNRGYGRRAVGKLLEYAFDELRLNHVRLSTFEDNLRAQASFRKAGFQEMSRSRVRGDRGRVSVWMGISRERWLTGVRQRPG